jgi:hypothetical protein
MALTEFGKQKISEYLFEKSDSLKDYPSILVELRTSSGAYVSASGGDDMILLNRGTGAWTAGSTSSNKIKVTAPVNQGTAQQITNFNLYVSAFNGTPILFAQNEPLTQNITVNQGETPVIEVGKLDIKFDFSSTDLESRVGHYVFENADQLGGYDSIRLRQYNGSTYLGKEVAVLRSSSNFDFTTSGDYTYNKLDLSFGVQGGTGNVTLNRIYVAIGGFSSPYIDLGYASVSSTSVAKGDTVRLKASTQAFKYYTS